eukprot:8031312-Lingulodinium_polyedra.AAC.1
MLAPCAADGAGTLAAPACSLGRPAAPPERSSPELAGRPPPRSFPSPDPASWSMSTGAARVAARASSRSFAARMSSASLS